MLAWRLLALGASRSGSTEALFSPLVVVPQRSLVRIYTRGGDKGDTSLFTGERRHKDDLVFDALGDSDELSAFIGIARGACATTSPDLNRSLGFIQETLLHLGSHLATPAPDHSDEPIDPALAKRIALTAFNPNLVGWLEQNIDQMTEKLPPLRNFILSQGGTSGHFHVARAVCRRLERGVVRLQHNGHPLDPAVLKYVNRLSDFFFTAARYVSHLENQNDEVFLTINKSPPTSTY